MRVMFPASGWHSYGENGGIASLLGEEHETSCGAHIVRCLSIAWFDRIACLERLAMPVSALHGAVDGHGLDLVPDKASAFRRTGSFKAKRAGLAGKVLICHCYSGILTMLVA